MEQAFMPSGDGLLLPVPRWTYFGEDYGLAVCKILRIVHRIYHGTLTCELFGKEFDPHHLLETEEKGAYVKKRSSEQSTDAFMVDMRFTELTESNLENIPDNACHAGLYEMAVCLMTYPESIRNWKDIDIVCFGDTASALNARKFDSLPQWSVGHGMIELHTKPKDREYDPCTYFATIQATHLTKAKAPMALAA